MIIFHDATSPDLVGSPSSRLRPVTQDLCATATPTFQGKTRITSPGKLRNKHASHGNVTEIYSAVSETIPQNGHIKNEGDVVHVQNLAQKVGIDRNFGSNGDPLVGHDAPVVGRNIGGSSGRDHGYLRACAAGANRSEGSRPVIANAVVARLVDAALRGGFIRGLVKADGSYNYCVRWTRNTIIKVDVTASARDENELFRQLWQIACDEIDRVVAP